MHRRLLFLAGWTAIAAAQPYDLIIRNARVWTGDPKSPFADSLGIRGDLIAAVGGVTGQAAQTIDAKGRLITPGFIDSHAHILDGGLHLTSVQLRGARTRQQFVDRIKAFAATVPEGTWITGGDWDHETWGGELPTRAWIDGATPRHPVWVNRLDGHMALANSVALKIAGVAKNSRETEGGVIARDAAGEPTGLLKDNAMRLVAEHQPEPSAEAQIKALDAAQEYLLSHGVTTVHHMGSAADLELFRGFYSARRLKIRIYAAWQIADFRRLVNFVRANERGDRWLRWGVLKGFQDGSLGSRTAAMESPFADAPGNTGLLVSRPEQIYDQLLYSGNGSLQVAVHAIGDRANRLLLDTYERANKVNGAGGQRSRIEHAQHLNAGDIPRFAALHVIASMQPYHAIDDGRWAERVIGPERAKTSYAFRSLLDAGAVLAFGSDWFVAPASVMQGIYAAVTRRTLDGRNPNGWVPSQKITVEEALRAYTWGGAFAAFEESYKGTLTPGRVADLVMLERDIFRIPPAEIGGVNVAMTVVGGKVAYERKAAQ